MVYLDNAASTAISPEAVAAMKRAWEHPGNPMSLHGAGRQARRILEESRESVARDLGARPSEVVFTSGGTESDNLAVVGIYRARRARDDRRRRVVISAVEHHAVLDPVEALVKHEGAEMVILPVDSHGRVDPADLRAELENHADEVALISVMWANNEVGTIQPIADLAALGKEFDVPVHSDAIAAVGHTPVDFTASGLSAMSVAAHKFGGPQGAGALLIGREVDCVPLFNGGGHERDLRSGTQDVAGAAGLAAALEVAITRFDENTAAVAALRDRLVDALAGIDGAVVNSRPDGSPASCTSPPPAARDSLRCSCQGGVECSTGSACSSGVASASHVLLAMGFDKATARASLRFSLSENTADEIDYVVSVLDEVCSRARAAGLTGVL